VAEPDNMPSEQKNARVLMLLVCIGLFMIALGNRSMLVSLPTLTQFFQTSVSVIQWALLVYDLAVIGMVLTLGRLGDLFGRKRFYVGGFLLFTFGSALCGLAQTPGQLIAFRIIQGIGGAMIMANGRAIIVASVAAAERGKALALTSTAFHAGFLAGPSLGGIVIDSLGWRWVFFINFPIGLAAAYFGWKFMPESMQSKEWKKIDFSGASYLLLSMSGLVYATNQIPSLGLTHPLVLSSLLAFSAGLVLFIRTELRAETPILNLSLFRSRAFSAANLALLFITFTQSSITLLMIFYLQNLMGFTPSQMSWIIIANSVVVILCAPLAGRLSDRFGSRVLCTLGTALVVLGQFLIASLTLHSSLFDMVFPLALSGLGWAMFNSPNQSAMLAAVPPDHIGAASGMNVTTARIGGALGLAVGSALFTYGLSTRGLTAAQIASPAGWTAAQDVFLKSFKYTIHVLNVFGLLAVFFSAVREQTARLNQLDKVDH
jgi:EmrB/QacA subfamily drug resistance transporter